MFNKQTLIEKLLVEHQKVVLRALTISHESGARWERVLPSSVHNYTEMFLRNIRDIVEEMK